jgi:alpha-L-arabinofuranosidase
MKWALAPNGLLSVCGPALSPSWFAGFVLILGWIASAAGQATTDITIGNEVLHPAVKRFGINLSGQTFYDSGQMMKNLIFRNPGFEGATWQSYLQCKSLAGTVCTDGDQHTIWPAAFLNGAEVRVISGRATGQATSVRASDAAAQGHGVTLHLTTIPVGLAAGDWVLVRMEKPGKAEAGWWPSASPGAKVTTESRDLSPHTLGKQALRVTTGPGQTATVASYFDSTEGRSFVQLRGQFVLKFRAKGIGAEQKVAVSIARLDKRHGTRTYLDRIVTLPEQWRDYELSFGANEDGTAVGTVGVSFRADGSSFLLDDVSLTPNEDFGRNPTPFRDEVVEALRTLHPGILRFMDNGTSFGSTLDDLIAPVAARRRGGWHVTNTEQDDIPIGLEESLELAEAVHAEPWYTLPATFSPDEAVRLVEFLAGPANSPYGAKRSARGHAAPWTTVFPMIHLELGNEVWNAGDFGGASLPDPAAYAARIGAVFGAARQSQYFRAGQFDLIAGGQAGNNWSTAEFMKRGTQQNTLAFAPYLFGLLDDVSSVEAVFGPMFAEPERLDVGGVMAEEARMARGGAHPTEPAVYEVNLGTTASHNNSITQGQIDATASSVGGAIAVADHMLLMLRELGIRNQCLFALPEYANPFHEPDGANKTTPLWGSVIDMGGSTNRRRPTYLAIELMNQALLPNEVAIRLTGANPTWNQPASANDQLPATKPHLLQVFAFADGAKRSLIVINLSRSSALPVRFYGGNSPVGTVTESRLTSGSITDTNEYETKVAIARRKLAGFRPDTPYTLPPYSMTVLEWQVGR